MCKFSFLAPELFTFLRSCRIVLMKSYKRPTFIEFSIVLVFGTLHVVGVAVLYFILAGGNVTWGRRVGTSRDFEIGGRL